LHISKCSFVDTSWHKNWIFGGKTFSQEGSLFGACLSGNQLLKAHLCVGVIDDVPDAVFSPECLAAVRLLLLSADAAGLSSEAAAVSPRPCSTSSLGAITYSAGVMTCDALRRCLLPVADILMSAGTHVYLSTVKLHRAMSMMVALTNHLKTSEGQNALATAE